MIEVITHHPAAFGIVGYWIFSAIVGGMPEPTVTSSSAYVWAHNSLHILAGNLTAAVSAHYSVLNSIPQALSPGSSIEHNETMSTVIVAPIKSV